MIRHWTWLHAALLGVSLLSVSSHAVSAAVSDARSDLEIEEAVRNELIWNVGVPAGQIHVEVTAGVAILTGTVSAPQQVEEAVQSAIRAGAWQVIDRLRVVRPPSTVP